MAGAGSTWFGAGNGSITLYEHDNFESKSRTLDPPMGNFDQTGSNDMSPLIMRGGLWELCTDAGIRVTRRVYRPGDYRSIDPRLSDPFPSTRQVLQ